MKICEHPSRGLSLVEIVLSLVIFLIGITALMNFFPTYLQTTNRAVQLTQAAFLAQMKAEELRRDDYGGEQEIITILESEGEFDAPTPAGGIPFAKHPEFSYAFSRKSFLNPDDDLIAARIIIYHTAKIDKSNPAKGIAYELTFGK